MQKSVPILRPNTLNRSGGEMPCLVAGFADSPASTFQPEKRPPFRLPHPIR